MAFLKADYSNNEQGGNFEPVPVGEYEVIIAHATEQATKNGKEELQLDFVIRNDLDAANPLNKKYHNRHIFMDNWKRNKTNPNTHKQAYVYEAAQLQYLIEAVGVPEGTEINSVDDFCKQLEGKPVQIYAQITSKEYNGETTKRNQVAPWNVHQTKFPQVAHQWKKDDHPAAEATTTAKPVDIQDNDLPF